MVSSAASPAACGDSCVDVIVAHLQGLVVGWSTGLILPRLRGGQREGREQARR